jgi:DNA invertase Pin-like site-specific DNA recombinase
MFAWFIVVAAIHIACSLIVRGGQTCTDDSNVVVRYAAYIRWSSTDQGLGYTREAQLRSIREDVERRGGQLVTIYTDEGRSGRRLAGRSEFRRMVEDAAEKRFDILIVHKLDRLARNLREALNQIDLLEGTYGVQVRSVQEDVDPASPYAGFIRTLMLALAETFSKNLASEVVKGQQEMFADGRHVGGVPVGYVLLHPRTRDSKLTPGPLAPLVRMAHTLYAEGRHGMAGIAAILNSEWTRHYADGDKPPFTRDTVRYVLRNRIYIGELGYKSERRVDPSLVIVDEEIFAEVQHRLKREGRRPAHAPRTVHRHLLAGLLTCARCGGKLDGCHVGTNRRYYRDRSRVLRRGCDQPTLRGRDLDARVARRLAGIGRMLPDDAVARVRSSLDSDAAKREARATTAALRAELDRVGHIYRHGNTTEDEYNRQQHDIKYHLARCEEILDLSLERSLTRIIEALRAIPRVLPYDDGDAIAVLNQGLRRVVETIRVDAMSEPEYVWSPAMRMLFDLLGVDPSVASSAHTDAPFPAIEQVIGTYLQLSLPHVPEIEQDGGRETRPCRPRRRSSRTVRRGRGPCPHQQPLFGGDHDRSEG